MSVDPHVPEQCVPHILGRVGAVTLLFRQDCHVSDEGAELQAKRVNGREKNSN